MRLKRFCLILSGLFLTQCITITRNYRANNVRKVLQQADSEVDRVAKKLHDNHDKVVSHYQTIMALNPPTGSAPYAEMGTLFESMNQTIGQFDAERSNLASMRGTLDPMLEGKKKIREGEPAYAHIEAATEKLPAIQKNIEALMAKYQRSANRFTELSNSTGIVEFDAAHNKAVLAELIAQGTQNIQRLRADLAVYQKDTSRAELHAEDLKRIVPLLDAIETRVTELAKWHEELRREVGDQTLAYIAPHMHSYRLIDGIRTMRGQIEADVNEVQAILTRLNTTEKKRGR